MGIVMGIAWVSRMGIERVSRMGIARVRKNCACGTYGGEPSVGNAWVSPQIFVENIRGVYLMTVNTHQNHARLSLDDS